MKIISESAVNGAVLTVDEGEDLICKEVFEFGEEEGLKGLQHMLYAIVEQLGESGSKHSKERIEIKVVHGHSYECKDKNCIMCKGDDI